MSARAAHDMATLSRILSPDVLTGGEELARQSDDYPFLVRYEQVVGWQFGDPSCSAGTPDRVVCAYLLNDAFNERAGNEAVPGSSFLLEIEDDRIVSVTHNVRGTDEFFAATERDFFTWVRENHPADLDVMLDDDRFLLIASVNLSPESVALWEQHVPAYLASET